MRRDETRRVETRRDETRRDKIRSYKLPCIQFQTLWYKWPGPTNNPSYRYTWPTEVILRPSTTAADIEAALTFLLVEHHLRLQFHLLVERALHFVPFRLRRVAAVQEATCAAARHHLRAREARQLAEAVRAVHDRVAMRLRVAQHEVAVCNGTRMKRYLLLIFFDFFYRFC